MEFVSLPCIVASILSQNFHRYMISPYIHPALSPCVEKGYLKASLHPSPRNSQLFFYRTLSLSCLQASAWALWAALGVRVIHKRKVLRALASWCVQRACTVK
jgi:hypothetical protein